MKRPSPTGFAYQMFVLRFDALPSAFRCPHLWTTVWMPLDRGGKGIGLGVDDCDDVRLM
jgi:hypothetical protein